MKGHKTSISIVIFKEVPMSADGYNQWNHRLRGCLRKIVFKFEMALGQVPVVLISSKQRIINFIEHHCGEGTWIMRGYSKAKTSKRCKMVRLAKVTVRESGGRYRSWICDTWRLQRRYWFWRDSKLLDDKSQYKPSELQFFADSSSLRHKEFKGVGDG